MKSSMMKRVLPRLNEELRAKVMGKVIAAVSELPEKGRLKTVRDIVSFLGELEDKDREKLMRTSSN